MHWIGFDYKNTAFLRELTNKLGGDINDTINFIVTEYRTVVFPDQVIASPRVEVVAYEVETPQLGEEYLYYDADDDAWEQRTWTGEEVPDSKHWLRKPDMRMYLEYRV
jgi:hypothetical protein